MGGNSFYSNAEAYALEILQQKLLKDAQRSVQQTVMELTALKSFLGQGQLVYCIPFGGVPFSSPLVPFPLGFFPCNGCVPTEPCHLPDSHHPTLPPSLSATCPPSSSPPGIQPTTASSPCSSAPNHHAGQSVVHVNVKNAQSKMFSNKPGLDECNLGKDGIEVTIDLRKYLPAEISLNVDEKVLEIKANHVDAQGSKSFARRYDLPACIILDSIKCILSHDGFLLFSAAWCKME